MNRVALLFSNAEYASALARAVESASSEYAIDVISQAPIRERVSRTVRGEYDLLVADEPIGNGPFAATLASLLGVPFAVVLRGWADLTNEHGEWGRLRARSIATRARASVRLADGVFVLSDVTRERLASQYPIERAITVGRPIDVSRYRSGTTRPTADEHVVLTVTNLRYEAKFEGVKTILDGLEPIFEREDALRYRVAGAGRYLPALRKYVSAYAHAERVEVLGWREDVPDLLAAADSFVYVSYLDSISTAVLEAQAAGLPVIGGDAVGVPVALGEAGRLCPPTPSGVTESVERLVADASYRRELARRADARMSTYNERAARQYLRTWNALIGGRSPAERDSPALGSARVHRRERIDG